MESKVSYTLVGLFVLVLGTALLGAVVWLTVGTEPKDYQRYRVYTSESVAGLNPKATVKYLGVDVGQVAAIELAPATEARDRVELLLEIETGTPIREDTEAVLVTQGLTGLAYVELTGGRGRLVDPPADGSLPEIRSGPSLIKRLDDAFTKFVEQYDELMARFNDMSARLARLLSDENQAALEQTLANAATITGAVAGRSEGLAEGLGAAAQALQQSATLAAGTTELLARLSGGVTTVEEMAQSFTQTSAALAVAVEETRSDMREVARNTAPELDALLRELRALADTMNRFVEDVERNPRILLFGRSSGRPGPGEE